MCEDGECVYAGSGGCDGPVTYGPDPYAWEIHGDETEIWLCAEHYAQIAADI